MSINEIQAFCSAAPYAWADEMYWHSLDRDTPWEMFLCMASMIIGSILIVLSLMVMLDESMSGWSPKPSKLGRLPNFSFPRKPYLLVLRFII